MPLLCEETKKLAKHTPQSPSVCIERTDKYNQLKLVFHLFVSVRPFEAKSKGHIRWGSDGRLRPSTHVILLWQKCTRNSALEKLPEVQREMKFIVNLRSGKHNRKELS